MNKAIFQGLITLGLFFGIFFGLSKLDWLSILQIKKATQKTETKLGELFYDFFSKAEEEIDNREIVKPVDSLVQKLCSANGIPRNKIKVHIFNKAEVNAFALPDGHLVIYSGLIKASENQEELIGVIGHELAHIQLNHVMKKLARELGLSVLISMTTGGGGETIKQAAKMLSSSAFDRQMEKQADLKSVEYMSKANINPLPFANFLYRLTNEESDFNLSWVSTHPESEERAEYIIDYCKDKTTKNVHVLSEPSWRSLQAALDK